MKFIICFVVLILSADSFAQEYRILPKLEGPRRMKAIEEANDIYSDLKEFRISREWNSGSYKVTARALMANEEFVRLEKEPGKAVKVPIKKLSDEDRDFLENYSKFGKKADEFFEEYGRTVDQVHDSQMVYSEYQKAKSMQKDFKYAIERANAKEAKFDSLIGKAEGLVDVAKRKERASWTGGNPIKITAGQIKENSIGIKQIQLRFTNESSKEISAIKFQSKSFNDFGEEVGGNISSGKLITQDNIKGGAADTGTWSLTFQRTATKVKVSVSEVIFEDGTKWDSQGKSETFSVQLKN